MDHAINLVTFVITTLAGLVMDFIIFVDGFLASVLTEAHVPPNAQIILLVLASVAVVVLAIRLLGRVFAALIVVLLVLLLVHHMLPQMHVPQAHLPPGMNLPKIGNTTI